MEDFDHKLTFNTVFGALVEVRAMPIGATLGYNDAAKSMIDGLFNALVV